MKKKINSIQRVVALLDRDQIDYLDELGKDALFSAGHKLSRTKIISYLIDFLKASGLEGKNIDSEDEFLKKLQESIKEKL